jgi:hypothetical protein
MWQEYGKLLSRLLPGQMAPTINRPAANFDV